MMHDCMTRRGRLTPPHILLLRCVQQSVNSWCRGAFFPGLLSHCYYCSPNQSFNTSGASVNKRLPNNIDGSKVIY